MYQVSFTPVTATSDTIISHQPHSLSVDSSDTSGPQSVSFAVTGSVLSSIQETVAVVPVAQETDAVVHVALESPKFNPSSELALRRRNTLQDSRQAAATKIERLQVLDK